MVIATFVVDIDISRTRISEAKVMEQHAKVQSLLGFSRSGDVLAFLRIEESFSFSFREHAAPSTRKM